MTYHTLVALFSALFLVAATFACWWALRRDKRYSLSVAAILVAAAMWYFLGWVPALALAGAAVVGSIPGARRFFLGKKGWALAAVFGLSLIWAMYDEIRAVIANRRYGVPMEIRNTIHLLERPVEARLQEYPFKVTSYEEITMSGKWKKMLVPMLEGMEKNYWFKRGHVETAYYFENIGGMAFTLSRTPDRWDTDAFTGWKLMILAYLNTNKDNEVNKRLSQESETIATGWSLSEPPAVIRNTETVFVIVRAMEHTRNDTGKHEKYQIFDSMVLSQGRCFHLEGLFVNFSSVEEANTAMLTWIDYFIKGNEGNID